MRRIGTLPPAVDPRSFSDHLLTLGITSKVDQRPEGSDVWIHHEDHVARARAELDEFLKNPGDPRYHVAKESAKTIRRESDRLDRQYRRNFREMSGHWDMPNLRRRPLTSILIGISVAVYLLTRGGHGGELFSYLTFTPMGADGIGRRLGARAIESILQGQVWRLVTPIFIHFSPYHILFNMYALWSVGSVIEMRRGTSTLTWMVLALAVTSNVGQYLYNIYFGQPSAVFGGMSGVVYGLFGYVWIKGKLEPEQGMILHPQTVQIMLFWLVLCFTPFMGNVANAAHVVGLLVGIMLGQARL